MPPARGGSIKRLVSPLDPRHEPRPPWHPIAAESKRYARVEAVRTVIGAIETGMRTWGQEPPATR